jgi:hypothetical protein
LFHDYFTPRRAISIGSDADDTASPTASLRPRARLSTRSILSHAYAQRLLISIEISAWYTAGFHCRRRDQRAVGFTPHASGRDAGIFSHFENDVYFSRRAGDG